MLYIPIGGYTGSSTRTELAARIIAICANGPVHIGTDSKAFMDKAHGIMHRIRHHRGGRINYKVVYDGDLWEHFEKAVKTKGVHAIRITKVQGHVTQEQVDSKQYRAVDKRGNDKADEAADVGSALYGKDVIDTARFLLWGRWFGDTLVDLGEALGQRLWTPFWARHVPGAYFGAKSVPASAAQNNYPKR